MDNRIRVVTLTANKTLGKNDSGSLFVLNTTDGLTVTLPPISRGLFYDFVIRTAVTASDNYIIITQTADKMRGVLASARDDNTGKPFVATAADTITMNGGTTGGLVGTHIRITADDAVWNVVGRNVSASSEATPFS